MIGGMIFLAGYIVGIVTAIVVIGLLLPSPEEWRSRMRHPSTYPVDAVPNVTRAEVISPSPGRSDITVDGVRVIRILSDRPEL